MIRNLIEPAGLVRAFQEHPPEGFRALDLCSGIPAFSAAFDLLTTADPPVRRFVDALPFSKRWRRLLHARTCFVGTTVSEYALFPAAANPDNVAQCIIDSVGAGYPFVIVKDLPGDPVLVGEEAFAWSERLAGACEKLGFVTLEGQALAYVPIDFASVEEFLARRSHARRKNMRRKLRSASALRFEEVPAGSSIFTEGMMARLYELYLNVFRQSEINFDLLTESFFRALFLDGGNGGIVFLHYAGEALIGFNLCFRTPTMLVDKYIGFAYPQAHLHNLYTVSWFRNLEYALAHGLRYYVAGWTDPDIKRELGAEFTFTRHLVYVRNPFLRALLRRTKRLFESDAL
ncbi:MAG TPA: GNAT family N-acetyltransferase [Thermoanaerobaculia bacterium]|nr:GNAT family N-acetyltransferase [Thermoanaerobaculia bacterium]